MLSIIFVNNLQQCQLEVIRRVTEKAKISGRKCMHKKFHQQQGQELRTFLLSHRTIPTPWWIWVNVSKQLALITHRIQPNRRRLLGVFGKCGIIA